MLSYNPVHLTLHQMLCASLSQLLILICVDGGRLPSIYKTALEGVWASEAGFLVLALLSLSYGPLAGLTETGVGEGGGLKGSNQEITIPVLTMNLIVPSVIFQRGGSVGRRELDDGLTCV